MDATTRIEPRRALRAMRALLEDPDDTRHVFTIIEALSGDTPARLLRRFRTSPTGRRLLRERRDIVPLLADRGALRALPDGSLGRAYLAFVESEGIDARGLVEASVAGETSARDDGSELTWIADRLRDTHDLWHAAIGYRGDLVGEASILAFSLVQTWNPGIALIVLTALSRTFDTAVARTIVDGLRRGARATWLPAVEWESLLALPLDDVRSDLGLGAPPVYTPIRSHEIEERTCFFTSRAAAA